MPSAIAIKQIEGKPGKVYYPLEKITIPEHAPKENEVLRPSSAPRDSTNTPHPRPS